MLAALLLGFSLVAQPLVVILFQTIATFLAGLSDIGLTALGYDIVRQGAELRDRTAGFAIEVTEACDGHGILVSWIAVSLVLPGSWSARIVYLVSGFVLIQVFNLVRVMVLFAVAPSGTELFDAVHYFFFPLATGLLIIWLSVWVARVQMSLALTITLLASALAVLWYFVTELVTANTLVPISQFLLTVMNHSEFGTMAERSAGWTMGSNLVQSINPLTLYLAPLYPPDFSLALPLIIAVTLAARVSVVWFVMGCVGMMIALALAGMTAVWTVADANNVSQLIIEKGLGQAELQPYAIPSDFVISTSKLVQNTLVHFNLLVLPTLMMYSQSLRHGRIS